ncbi:MULTISPECIES: MMPL family transporter [unclassified Streptomyces]|uniref:MMPL family transporter n=1 Tax=unclassified Streptomyces TaxID=2593676 RepID=UPI002DD98FE6|nr:MMPL family transporter [Streptomyces sp. NBC_01775]WSB75412.1 MMPL family transporter [Streptomyces sp. NBC_01775]WSS45123.1 MMPL family transporter [Streptomyces sp. NBC_01187]
MLRRIADLTHRRARVVLLLSLLAAVGLAAIGFGAFGQLKGGGFDDPDSPSSRAATVIDDTFHGEDNLVLLVRAKGGKLDAPAAKKAGTELTKGLKSQEGVTQVASYWAPGGSALTSRDGTQALVLAHVDEEDTETVKDITDKWSGERGAVSVRAGGGAALNEQVNAQVSKDLAVAESIAVPVTLILLIIAFGSVVAALLPLAIGLVAILGTFAELYVIGSITDVSVFAVNLTTALGLGLGIDYGLLLVSRFRERLSAGDEIAVALRTTVRTAGRTILFSASTVVAALAALLLFPQYFLRSFAYAGIGVVFIAALSALFIVPALLAVLGHRVNKGRLPWADAVRKPEAPLWGRLARTVMRRPALTALPVLAVLLLAASPLLGANFGSPDERVLPESAESRQVSTALQHDFAGNESAGVQVVTEGRAADGAVADYARKISRLDGVVRVQAATGTYAEGRSVRAPGAAHAGFSEHGVHRMSVTTKLTPASEKAQDLVREIRDLPGPGTDTLVGGRDAALIDSKASIGDKLPAAVAWIVGSTFVLLFLFTGSVVQPLRALVLNGISLTAAIGAMVWVFQDGHLSSLLGFTAMPMDTSMTVLMFCIVFGLSMDYEVFVTSRIKELHDAGASDHEAVVGGLSRTGRIVTMAAGLLAVSFFAFVTGNVSFIQMFGLGSGLAILIDAVAVRGVLVPAAMRLLGRTAWYAPGPLRRLHAKAGLSESGAEEADGETDGKDRHHTPTGV